MIIISGGHYWSKPGACQGTFCEFPSTVDFAFEIAYLLSLDHKLEATVAPVGSLTKKVKFINNLCKLYDVKLAAEIHFNSAPGAQPGKVKGSEILFCPGSVKGKSMAEIVNESMRSVGHSRGVKEGWYRMDRPGIKDYAEDKEGDEVVDYFLRSTKCPALILEPEFIQNHFSWLLRQDSICSAIADGIAKAVKNV